MVVTGAAGGIGSALARRFAAEGARGLLLADLDAGRVEDLALALDREGCHTVGVGSDVSRESDVQALIPWLDWAFESCLTALNNPQ